MAGCTDTGGGGDFFGRLFASHPVEVAPPTPDQPVRPHPVAVAPPAPDVEAGVKPRRPAAKRPAEPSPADSQTAAVPTPGDLGAQAPKLIGLTEQETVTLLGPPSAQWDRPPAKVWHYQGPDCAVDVFFYLDVSRNEFSALRTMASGTDGAPAAVPPGQPPGQPNGQQCLTRIRDVAQRK